MVVKYVFQRLKTFKFDIRSWYFVRQDATLWLWFWSNTLLLFHVDTEAKSALSISLSHINSKVKILCSTTMSFVCLSFVGSKQVNQVKQEKQVNKVDQRWRRILCTTTVEVDSSAIVTLRATSKQPLPRLFYDFEGIRHYDIWMNDYVNDQWLVWRMQKQSDINYFKEGNIFENLAFSLFATYLTRLPNANVLT